jgi:hypothetical protein
LKTIFFTLLKNWLHKFQCNTAIFISLTGMTLINISFKKFILCLTQFYKIDLTLYKTILSLIPIIQCNIWVFPTKVPWVIGIVGKVAAVERGHKKKQLPYKCSFLYSDVSIIIMNSKIIILCQLNWYSSAIMHRITFRFNIIFWVGSNN